MSTRHPIKSNEESQGTLDSEAETLMRRLQQHVTLARTRLTAYEVIHKARHDREFDNALAPARVFFLFTEDALYLDVAITLEKIYDPKGKRSLPKYLNKCLNDLSALSFDRSVLNADALNDQIRRVRSLPYDRLRMLRDKWLAHHDPVAFDEPQRFSASHTLSRSDLEPFAALAQEILIAHYQARGSDLSPGLPGSDDANNLIAILQRYQSVRIEWAMGRIEAEEAMRQLYEFETRLRGNPF